MKWVWAESKKWARECKQPAKVVDNYRVVLGLLDLVEEHCRLSADEFLVHGLVEMKLSAANQALAVYWR